MSPRLLALLPFAALAVFLGSYAAVGAGAEPIVLRVGQESAKALALAGCLAAALAFERGAHLRRAWLLCGGCYALLLTRDAGAIFLPAAPAPPPAAWIPVQSVLVLAANASTVAGTWLLARTYAVAGIDLPGTDVSRVVVHAVAAIIAVAIIGVPASAHLGMAISGDVAGIVLLVSDVGDAISLCLIAPLALTAFAMRGGSLVWPWGLLTTSFLFWLWYDAAPVLSGLMGLDRPRARLLGEAGRIVACAFTFSAGWAQRQVNRADGQ